MLSVVRRIVVWAFVDRVWPAFALAVPLVLAFSGWFADVAERNGIARQPRLQAAAEAWTQRNGVPATVTCFAMSRICDVVPKDPRPPFRIECSVDDGPPLCWVETR